jgi:hypothetical protein
LGEIRRKRSALTAVESSCGARSVRFLCACIVKPCKLRVKNAQVQWAPRPEALLFCTLREHCSRWNGNVRPLLLQHRWRHTCWQRSAWSRGQLLLYQLHAWSLAIRNDCSPRIRYGCVQMQLFWPVAGLVQSRTMQLASCELRRWYIPYTEDAVVTLCTTRFNILKICVLPTQCIYMFCVDLRTNSDYFTVQH